MSIPSTEPPAFVAAIAATIRVELARKDTTRTELAEAIGVAPSGLSRRLAGETPWTLSELVAVARFFDVRLSVIMPDELAHQALKPEPTS